VDLDRQFLRGEKPFHQYRQLRAFISFIPDLADPLSAHIAEGSGYVGAPPRLFDQMLV
jgi:hypothetical protein